MSMGGFVAASVGARSQYILARGELVEPRAEAARPSTGSGRASVLKRPTLHIDLSNAVRRSSLAAFLVLCVVSGFSRTVHAQTSSDALPELIKPVNDFATVIESE